MWHQQFLVVWQQLNESRTGAGSKRSSLTGFVQSWFQVLQIPAQLEKSGWTEKQWTMCTARRFMISVKKHVLLIQNGPLTWSQMGWRRMTLVVMTARHCSCPPVLWAAAVQDAPDKQKQTVKHLFLCLFNFLFVREMLTKYLVPVRWSRLLLYLLLNPLQVDCDEILEAFAIIRLRREGPTVSHQSVHPVLIDKLKQTGSKLKTTWLEHKQAWINKGLPEMWVQPPLHQQHTPEYCHCNDCW